MTTCEGGTYESNDAFLWLVGYTRDDLAAGQIDWAEMTPREYRGQDALALETLRAMGVRPRREKEYVRKDGARVPVLVGGIALDEDRPHGLAFIDLSDRRRTERALAQGERRFRATFEQAALGMAHVAPTVRGSRRTRACARSSATDVRDCWASPFRTSRTPMT